jgi:hypothetical protein
MSKATKKVNDLAALAALAPVTGNDAPAPTGATPLAPATVIEHPANDAPVATNTAPVDGKAWWANQRDRIALVKKGYDESGTLAATIAKENLAHFFEHRNGDPMRALWEALPERMQPLLVRWLKAVSPLVKKVKKHPTKPDVKVVSFAIDRKRERKEGFICYDEVAASMSFLAFKPAKKDKDDSLDALLESVSKRLESMADKSFSMADTDTTSRARKAADTLSKASLLVDTIRTGIVPGAATDTADNIAQSAKVRDELTGNTPNENAAD